MKKALITGVTGQDGAYLSELLLKKGMTSQLVAIYPIKEELEADIANIAARLSSVAIPDYYAFCVDVETIFNGAQPSGPIAGLQDLDWKTFRKNMSIPGWASKGWPWRFKARNLIMIRMSFVP